MRRTPHTFILPRTFDPTEFLSGLLTLRADDARWLVNTILRKTANRDTDLWGCVRLHSRILYRVIGNHAGDLVRALEAGGAIETTPYRASETCKSYRLARRYLGDRCVRVPCVDPRLRERLERERKRMQDQADQARAGWLAIHHALDAEQRRLSIDPSADAILDALPDHTRLCQSVLVDSLRHREFPFSLSTTGRVFNGITALKRELRTALRIGDERMGGVDIACCQPALLALAMTRGTPANGLKGPETYKHYCLPPVFCPGPPSLCPLPPDAVRFRALVLAGRLYEHLMDLTGLDRNVVKLRFLVDVLAKRGNYPSVVEQSFRLAFPSVHFYIREINRHDHATLIRLLQRLESWLVVEQVAPLYARSHAMAKKKRKLSEDAAWEIALRDHPEWRRAWRKDELPDEIVGDDGEPMSPRAHIQVHAVVERQLAADEPQGVAAIARELERLGVLKHDVRHEIGCVITEHMWYATKEGCPFDARRYLAALRKVVNSHR